LEGQLFCANHGTCRDNYLEGCACPAGFSGFSCEYENVSEDPNDADAATNAADVELCGANVCHNGGTCVTSIVTAADGNEKHQLHCDCSTAATDETAYAGESCQHEASVFCTLPKDGAGLGNSLFCVNDGECGDNVLQGCDCPTGWTGFRCEFAEDAEDITEGADEDNDTVECGDSYCFNGGECESVQEVDNEGNASQVAVCNCAAAVTDTDLYAGTNCQFKSTSICTESEDGGGLKGQMFCANHGTCGASPADGCDCPTGWNGEMCQFQVEDDSDADEGEACGDGFCYNGGGCVSTKIISKNGDESTRFHCDCATAFDDTDLYAGESCEFKSTALCTSPPRADSLEGTIFCVNGGKCNEQVNQGCDCPIEWDGFSCEYPAEVEDVADDIEEPDDIEECGDLVCLNGGVCTTTMITTKEGDTTESKHCDCANAYTDTDLFAGPQCEHKSTAFCTQPEDDADLAGVQFCVNGGSCKDDVLRSCDCPPAWTGFRCEFESDPQDFSEGPQIVENYEKCGDDFCYHGGKCNPYEVNGKTHYGCDCSTAVTDADLYAGRFCQYRSTVLCSQLNGDNLEGVEFCVNGGECRNEGGCGCPTGYEGLRCEFSLVDGQDSEDDIAPNDGNHGIDNDEEYTCHLQCQNGGVCAKGAKDLGSAHHAIEHVSHLNQTYDEQFFEHCVCQDGWIGLECEHKADYCGENEHICLHGSTCVKNNQQHGCDCSDADEQVGGADHPLFAGDSCQHPATDICSEGENYPGRPLYFCVNQGRCRAYVTGEEENPGCDCVGGWTGPHCEVRVEATADGPREIERRGLQVFLIILLAVITIAFLLVIISYCTRNRTYEDMDDSKSCMYFRRRRRTGLLNPDDHHRANLAPQRADVADPPAGIFSSSSDPMTAGLTLPPDDEPEPYQDEPSEPYLDEPVVVNIGPPKDEDGHELHNVDFV